MPRSAEFDRTKALEAAMKLFWARGYTACSLPDLLAAMNIARSSFYASYSTKRELFVECLIMFGDRTLTMVERHAEDRSATELARAFFESTMLQVSPNKVQQGCMMVNTVLELADVDSELCELATDKLDAIENAFVRAFTADLSSGASTSHLDPQTLAALVMTLNLGLRVQCRRPHSPAELQHLIDNSLSMLEQAA
ncbi:TetR family transcriptional regulator [Halioglobus japonicus]|uniref:TetR/AcrR family transcriptional regulator n=1 Tax=Halioglobus japonicus TaxID=930805 RepID=A0AAP8MHS2_9GAMM|nr:MULTISPECIES: TetR/AcrR family transcriptional regulator [Halioglobus]AQA19252.1 TetR family transcriptional regulator [Halioglobus japonicus]KZX59070.1 hypothetical protein A3709_16080 [Halioglobus sp. HI00S01]PLW87712.1 TetR/AcrR family transcriptional regulator [Halioglobus japonicus]GHD06991.1 TetR family transcriptional regulator [Halioglobus japonicus]